MNTQARSSLSKQRSYYEKIAHALEYLDTHFSEQPNLDKVATQVHLSPFHFQKLFTDWVGISPKKYLQFVSLTHAKQLLQKTPWPTLRTQPAYRAQADCTIYLGSRLSKYFVILET